LRRYEDPSGNAVWLYVGFHNNASFGGTTPHSPRLCYPGQGWTVLDATIEKIPLADGSSNPDNRLLVQKGLEQRLVLYWLQWGSEVTTESGAGDYTAKLGWLLRLPFLAQEDTRTDRSLVRVSARVDLSPERTFATGARFVALVFPLLAEHFHLMPPTTSDEPDAQVEQADEDDSARD
jgi:EpsI family protein